MGEKKVIAVIVEGPSDENAIGGILKEYFSSDEVQFAVVHGDITSNKNTSVDNVVSKVCDLIDAMRSKYGYHWEDFLQIIHITDTDGAFTKGCVVEAEVDSIQYYEERMEASNVKATEERNQRLCLSYIQQERYMRSDIGYISIPATWSMCYTMN